VIRQLATQRELDRPRVARDRQIVGIQVGRARKEGDPVHGCREDETVRVDPVIEEASKRLLFREVLGSLWSPEALGQARLGVGVD
jgi:hypothetical protein